MSTKNKPRASAPPPLGARVPSVNIPPTSRKSSQPNLPTQSQSGTPKFYTGPTVSQQKPDVKQKVNAAAAKTSAVTKASSKRAVATVRRHPWGFFSLLTTLPFILLISLASTVLCPPPGEPTALNRYVFSPLGYTPHQSHPTLCYPANVYHREVLQPYVYPLLDDVHARVTSLPAYVNYVEPATTQAKAAGLKAWNGPIKPVVNRTVRGARRFYLTFIQPHIPYLRARWHAITSPYTSRISAFASPHIATANAYAKAASERASASYNYAASHPLTGHASRYANQGYKIGSERGYQAYQWSRPHALRAGKEVERIATKVLGPRAVQAAELAAVHVGQAWKAFKAQVCLQYHNHLEPHVGPHVKKATAALAPYTALYAKHIHKPYVQPAYNSVFPPTPEKQSRSFLSILSDFLPTSGSPHAAETKGQMDDYFSDLEHSRHPADVEVPGADKIAQKPVTPPAPAADASKQEKKAAAKAEDDFKGMERSEMDRVREALKARVDKQGKQGLAQVKQEIGKLHNDVLKNQLPELYTNFRSEIEREIEYVARGLDKLYTGSTTLTRDQVKKSSEQADARVGRTVEKIKTRLDAKKKKVYEEGKPIVRAQFDLLDAAMGKEYQDLAMKMSWIDDITVKDWDKYHEIRKLADAYKDKYIALHEDPAITKPFAEFRTELGEFHEGLRARVGILKRTALDRIDAREAMAADETKPEPSRVSILPVVGAGGAAAAAGGAIIGKGKEQVLSALSQANAAAAQGTATTGVVDQAKASAESAVKAVSEGVHDATRAAVSAVGGTPSPESPREHVESVYAAAASSAESLADAAVSAAHEATRSALRAVGATPSPESLGESAESLLAAASAAAALAASAAGEKARATPSPESPAEHVESAYHAATDSASSIVSEYSALASSAASDASAAIHDATRSAVSAVGGTPTPETPGEHLESIANVVAQSAASVYGVVGDGVHDATRSVVKAAGGTPSPESPREHAESAYTAVSSGVASVAGAAVEEAARLATQIQEALGLVEEPTPLAASATSYLADLASSGSSLGSEALATGSSLLSSLQAEASTSLHSATRAASRAAGVTPTPESAGEYVDEAKARAASARSVAERLVRKHASQIASDLAKESKKPEDYRHKHDDEHHGHAHGHVGDEL
ncbi:hypothetical protein IAT38_001872 [Cryptococcus sp. DSM 104549]